MNTDQLSDWLDTNEITTVRTEAITLDGMSVGKHLSRRKFEHCLPLGPAISDLVLSVDPGGEFYLGFWGDWRSGIFGDIHQRPDLATLELMPGQQGVATCMADHVNMAGEPLSICPRATLQRVVGELNKLGYRALVACEIEVMLFNESFSEARDEGYRDLTGIGSPVSMAYLNQSAHQQSTFMAEVTRRLDTLQIPWDGWNDEMAPGQVELNLPPSDPLTACDQTHRVRQVFREVAYDLDKSVTFMGKPNAGWGNGMHIHHSLLQNGEPIFYDATEPNNLSKLMCRWLAGLMATMNGTVSLLTPTINSYRRMVEFGAAPTTPTWAEENKSTAIRLITRNPRLARIEYRIGSGELNPYTAVAAILAGGISGLKEEIDLPEPAVGLAWGLPEDQPRLPNNITDAAEALESDTRLIEFLGSEFVQHWVNTRRWESSMYTTKCDNPDAESVTDWELNRYFELV
jgi:glutamine synthetase